METAQKPAKNVPGTKNANGENVKQKNDSPSYALKSFGRSIMRMHKMKMVTTEELAVLSEVHQKAVQRWISIGLELK